MYVKPIDNIILNSKKKTENFTSEIKNKAKVPISTNSIQQSTRNLSQST